MSRMMEIRADPYQALMNNAFDGIYQIDADGRITAWNKGAERITGIRAEQVVGTYCHDNPLKHQNPNRVELREGDLPMLGTLNDGEPRELYGFLKHADGFRISVVIRTFAVRDEKGRIAGAVEIFNDNKILIAAYQRSRGVEQTIMIDALTGIGNRTHIEHRITSAIEDYKDTGLIFGILFVDIDHFKDFNDIHGHLTGDKVLRYVANTLKHYLRVTDSCGRWGGEEFIALVLNVKAENLRIVAEKLRSSIEQSVIHENGLDMNLTISIGATLIRPNDTLRSLIQRADRLMYKSKKAGRNRVTMRG
jgi:diguanylate cyclase (GGDEF)-like protein/PAS domain S-box-containing protein